MTRPLRQLQTDFQDYVLGLGGDRSDIIEDIDTRHGLQAEKRLAIYYNAYRIRLRDALGEAYGKTHSYLGDDLFFEMAEGYVEKHPSRFQNLRWYGADFAGYLSQALDEYPIVAELARFEWALGCAFDAADAPVLAMEQLRDVTAEAWETIGFQLQPSVQFLPLRRNAPAVWLALEKEQAPPDAAGSDTPTCWLIWRNALQPHFRSLDDYEAQALMGLQQRLSFSAVCERAVAEAGEQDITPQIAGWLQIWLAEGVLTRIDYLD